MVTTATGRAHLLFLDRSSLIVAPNSELVLDEYTYDPKTKTGKVVFSTAKGFFRYVGGTLSKNKNAIVFRTPLATIGLRGGIADIDVIEAGGKTARVTATKLFGTQVIVTPIGADAAAGTEIRRNGFKATVGAGGRTVVLAKATPSDLSRNLKRVEGEKGLPQVTQPAAGGGGTTPAFVQTAVLLDQSSPVPDSDALEPPDTLAPDTVEPSQTDPVRSMLGVGVTSGLIETDPVKSMLGVDVTIGLIPNQKDITSSVQDAISDDLATITTTELYSGWFQRSPLQDFAALTTAFPLPASAPTFDANNIVFSGARVIDGVFSAAIGAQTLSLQVPRFDDFVLDSQATDFVLDSQATIFGEVSGTGFFSDDPHFIFYSLDLLDTGEFATLFGGSPFTGTFPTSGFATHEFNLGHPIPTAAGGEILDLASLTIYSAYGTDTGGDIRGNADTNCSVAGGAVVVFDESGASQRSAMFGFTGNYVQRHLGGVGLNKGPMELAAFGRGNARLSETTHGVRSSFGTSTMLDAAGNSFFGETGPDFFVLGTESVSGFFDGPREEDRVGLYQLIDAVGLGLTAFFANGYATPSTAPIGLGTMRTTRFKFGYTGGISEVRSGGAFAFDYVFNNDPGFPVTASPSGQSTFRIVTNAADNSVTALLLTQDVDSAYGNRYIFGGASAPVAASGSRAAFIDDDRFVMRDRFVAPGDETVVSANVGSIGVGVLGTPPGSGDPIVRGNLLLATSEMFGNVLPSGVTPCACEYLTWGYWSGDVRTGDATVATSPFRRENIHLASWVAGQIPEAADIPSADITAVYNGHIVGAVNDAGSYAIRAATFSHSYNFLSRTGTFTVDGFDGVSYSGPTSSPGQANDFQAGAIAGAGSDRVIKLEGSFFSSPTDVVKYNGGNFSVRNPANTYKGGGIFAGQR